VRLLLYVPMPPRDNHEIFAIETNLADSARFTDIAIIDLMDASAISALLEEASDSE